MIAKLKEVTLKAIDYIVTLDDESQRPAAKFFYHQAVIAMKAPETVNKHVALFFGHIVEFLNKNFRYVQVALDEVMYDIEAIIDELRDPLRSSPMAHQAGHLVKFVGRCNWPASVALSVATAGTSNLVHTLAQNGIKLEKKSVTRDEDSGTIESRINLEIPSDSDGASLFKRAVDGLGNDGHFIPNAPIAAF